jgi:hypothetical protein
MRTLEKADTPLETVGIEIRGTDKWLTIIQNARKNHMLTN